MSVQEFRWTINLRLRVDGPESKKDTVTAALKALAQQALAAGNIDHAECNVTGAPIPEGWVVK